MQSPSHLRGWGSHLRQEEGQGHQSRGGRGWGRGGRREAAEPRARPWEAGRGGRRPGSLQPRPPRGLPRFEGRGREARQKPNRAAPAGELCRGRPLPRLPQPPPPPAPAAGVHRRPLAPAAAAKFLPRLRSANRSPRAPPASCPPPRATAARTYTPLAGRGHRARAPRRPVSPPRAKPPRPRPVRAGGGALVTRPLGSYRRSHSGGSCPGAVGGRPRGTRELGRGRGAVGVGGVRRPPPSPRPARRAHLSCQGPAAPPRLTHAAATVAPCLSKLLISPGAARRRRRRRLGPLGRWSFRGPGQETPAAVAAAEDTPKRNAAHSRATGSLPAP